jgi:hypothetical protein
MRDEYRVGDEIFKTTTLPANAPPGIGPGQEPPAEFRGAERVGLLDTATLLETFVQVRKDDIDPLAIDRVIALFTREQIEEVVFLLAMAVAVRSGDDATDKLIADLRQEAASRW